MALKYQDYPGEYVKRFDDATPETFVWISKTPSVTPEYKEYQDWLAAGNTLIAPPPEPDPAVPMLVIDQIFLDEINGAQNLQGIKKAIVDAADRAKNRGGHG